MRLLLPLIAACLPTAAIAQQSSDILVQQHIEVGRVIAVNSTFFQANFAGDRRFVDQALWGPSRDELIAMGRCIVAADPELAARFAAASRGTAGLRPVFDRCGQAGLRGGYDARTAMRRAMVRLALSERTVPRG